MLGALEHHVLNEMRNPIELRILIARSAVYPNPNGDRADVLHLFGNDGQPVGQDFAMDIPEFFNHKLLPTGTLQGRNQQGLPSIVTHWNRSRECESNC